MEVHREKQYSLFNTLKLLAKLIFFSKRQMEEIMFQKYSDLSLHFSELYGEFCAYLHLTKSAVPKRRDNALRQ